MPAQNSTVQQYNLVSFQTGLLSPGSHHLFVQYAFDNLVLEQGSAPLVLDYFIIQNQTSPSRPLSQGGIAGVVIGSLVGLAIIIYICIIFGPIWFIKGKKAAASLGQECKPDAAFSESAGLPGEKIGPIRFIKGKKAAASLGREHISDAAYSEGPGLPGEKMTIATL